MKIKLDENLGHTHRHFLQQLGYEVDRVYDEGLSGAKDPIIWQHVCYENRFFITLDLDFSDVRHYPPGTHPGILLIRSKTRGRVSVLDVLRRVFAEHRLESLEGCLVVADEQRTRIRHPHNKTEQT